MPSGVNSDRKNANNTIACVQHSGQSVSSQNVKSEHQSERFAMVSRVSVWAVVSRVKDCMEHHFPTCSPPTDRNYVTSESIVFLTRST